MEVYERTVPERLVVLTRRPQVIQTVSAVDKDEPLSGHRFYFALAAAVAGNPNFTLRDNKARALPPLRHADNTASVLTRRGGFRRREQLVYRLPVLIVDSGSPALSSTNTLSVRVCDCDSDSVALSCGAVASTATGLSTGALVAILGCIITLLGKKPRDLVVRADGGRRYSELRVIFVAEVILPAALNSAPGR
ncbi:Cadherin-7 [Liparis tanakae]|uniref:Cadherin-7 n=1 Tax=Liparis tanakae TaxID=230148 RepID=A0A4Z2GPW3_9TELE|nr:Cadherin-7 [Liparis tanakae]